MKFNPIKSSVTSTCPSQWEEAPIPIVGIFKDLVICLANEVSTHSRTIENTPANSNRLASFKSIFLSFVFLPLWINFPF